MVNYTQSAESWCADQSAYPRQYGNAGGTKSGIGDDVRYYVPNPSMVQTQDRSDRLDPDFTS